MTQLSVSNPSLPSSLRRLLEELKAAGYESRLTVYSASETELRNKGVDTVLLRFWANKKLPAGLDAHGEIIVSVIEDPEDRITFCIHRELIL